MANKERSVPFASIYRLKAEQTISVPLVEFISLVFTRIPSERQRRPLRPLLLCSCSAWVTLTNFPIFGTSVDKLLHLSHHFSLFLTVSLLFN